jgi:hypothetical protein
MRALIRILFFPVAMSLTLSIPDSLCGQQAPAPPGMTPPFDGKTLNAWIDAENGMATFDGGGITDLAAFAKKLTDKPDAVSAFLSGQLANTDKANLAAFSPTNANVKAVSSVLVKALNKIGCGPSIYDAGRFQNIQLRTETRELLRKNSQGQELARLNKILIEDAYPAELSKSRMTNLSRLNQN